MSADLRMLFSHLDPESLGEVPREALIAALRKDPHLAQYLGLPAQKAPGDAGAVEIESLFERLDTDHSGGISWEATLHSHLQPRPKDLVLHLHRDPRAPSWQEFKEAAQIQQQLEASEPPTQAEAVPWPYSRAAEGWEEEAAKRDRRDSSSSSSSSASSS